MMEKTAVSEAPTSRDIVKLCRYHLGGRRGPIAAAALLAAAGLAFNWSWLVAAGIAPLLIAVLPCLVMCGLGLCMSRMAGASCRTGTAPRAVADPAPRPIQALPASAPPAGSPEGEAAAPGKPDRQA